MAASFATLSPVNGELDASAFWTSFFFKQGLGGIEIDGGYHNDAKQRCVDTLKARASEEAGVTLIRITNDEVFGNRKVLLKKVREGLLRALLRGKSS
jgi:very-short-patch-repair endonuclease